MIRAAFLRRMAMVAVGSLLFEVRVPEIESEPEDGENVVYVISPERLYVTDLAGNNNGPVRAVVRRVLVR